MSRFLEWLWPHKPVNAGERATRPVSNDVASPRAQTKMALDKRVGPQSDSAYLHSSQWDELLVPRKDGRPPFRLRRHEDELWLAEETTEKLVNVGNRKLRGLGIWTVSVRGMSYHLAHVKRAELSPGSPVQLVREPDNLHDENAVAVHAGGAVVGYVNKQMARQLSKALAQGLTLEAMALSGDLAGRSTGKRVRVLAASPETMQWLRSRR